MKAATDRAATRRVLAGIDAVLRERTAAAVERVLATASRGCSEWWGAFANVTEPLLRDLGEVAEWPQDSCRYCCEFDCEADDIAGLRYYLGKAPDDERERYAPENISPHLLPGGER